MSQIQMPEGRQITEEIESRGSGTEDILKKKEGKRQEKDGRKMERQEKERWVAKNGEGEAEEEGMGCSGGGEID